MDKIFQLTELLVEKGVEFSIIGRLFFYTLPMLITLTIPMALLFSLLVTFGRLSYDNEVVAIATSGVNLITLLFPLLIFALILSGALSAFNDIVLPKANSVYNKIYFDILSKKAEVIIKERVYIKEFKDLIIYVEKVNPRLSRLENLTIYFLESGRLQGVSFAKEGMIKLDKTHQKVYIRLTEGELHQKTGTRYTKLEYDFLEKALSLEAMPRALKLWKSAHEMSCQEILKEIRKREANKKEVASLWVELHKKFAIPFACFAFTLLGVPLGIVTKRSGKGVGLGISMFFIAAYYFFLVFGENLAVSGRIPASVGIWFPNAAAAVAGVILIWRNLLQKRINFRRIIRWRKRP
jgi:lipopolysaccharide export system permease protein